MSYHYFKGFELKDEQLTAAFLRDSENDYELSQMDKIANIYTSPATYINDKKKAIGVAGGLAAEVYKDQYKALLLKKLPASACHERAQSMANAYLAALKIDIELDYPQNFSQLAVTLGHGRTDAAKSGFAQPSTEINTPRGAGPSPAASTTPATPAPGLPRARRRATAFRAASKYAILIVSST